MLARAVYPLVRIAGMAARAVNDRPYGVVNFVAAIFRDDVVFPAGL